MTTDTDRQYQQQMFALWCAPIFSLMVGIGWFWFGDYWLPAAADLSAQATKQYYVVDHRMAIIWGNAIFIIACPILCIDSIQTGLMLADIEGRRPGWSIATIVGGVGIAVVTFISNCFWISAAYRPNASADIVVALNDVAWLGFLLGWVWLGLQMLGTAIVGLGDRSPVPLIPRWLCIASLIGIIPVAFANGPAFTQSGPLAFHGSLAYYVPMGVWGVWLNLHNWYYRIGLKRQFASASGIAP